MPFPSGSGVGGAVPSQIQTVGLMIDKGTPLSLQEGFQRGAGMAHRGIMYCHKEFRNYGENRPSSARVR